MEAICVIITAAGNSTRMAQLGNKLALSVAGEPVIRKAVGAFLDAGLTNIYVVIPGGQRDQFAALLAPLQVSFVDGGATRQESVHHGLLALPGSCQHVLIHDGARPFASRDLIHRVVRATQEHGACIPGVPLVDTVYEAEQDSITRTLQRDKLVAIQTPQGFEKSLIMQAHSLAKERGLTATDDAALVKEMGGKVFVVPGDNANFKITTPEDLQKLPYSRSTRVGFGMDVHRLVEGRPLIIGGVNIPYSKGLLGHSDADVLVHALMDALLGAVGLGDIGQHFPDTDERYRGANSMELLAQVVSLLGERGASSENVDITLLLERPKIAPYKDDMKKNLIAALNLSEDQVNIKATTNEGMGYVGSGEGAVCYAVATVSVPR